MSTHLTRSALVLHSAQRMFDLVNDVASYPAFMADCEASEVLEQDVDFMVARLDLQKKGVRYSFTTRNQLQPPDKIQLNLHSGPFKSLTGLWSFKALTDTACKVTLDLDFEVNNHLAGVAASSLFASVANNLVSVFTERADQIYGKTVL
jgi:ribosome-associated toxin RatA of RatAB toxin-antitoxin module